MTHKRSVDAFAVHKPPEKEPLHLKERAPIYLDRSNNETDTMLMTFFVFALFMAGVVVLQIEFLGVLILNAILSTKLSFLQFDVRETLKDKDVPLVFQNQVSIEKTKLWFKRMSLIFNSWKQQEFEKQMGLMYGIAKGGPIHNPSLVQRIHAYIHMTRNRNLLIVSFFVTLVILIVSYITVSIVSGSS